MKALSLFLSLAVLMSWSSQSSADENDLAYFKQFIYAKESIGNDPDFPQYQYRFIVTKWNDMVQMPDGRYLNPSVSIFLYDNGTFLMTYKENYFETPTSTQFSLGPCRKIEGKWSVPEKQLVLEGVGRADRAFVDGKNALDLIYDVNLNSQGLKDHHVESSYGYANYGPEEAIMMCH